MRLQDLERYLSNTIKTGLYFILPLPLYISTSMLFPFITGRNFAFRIIIEILAIAWVGLLVMSREYRPRLTPLVKAVIVLLFIVTLADILGVNPYRSFWSNYERMEGLLGLIHMVLFFLIAASMFRKVSDWRLYLYGSSIVSVFVALTALFQNLGLARSYQGGVRVDGTIGNPAYLASYLMFHVFFLLFLAYRERRSWLRWAAISAAVFELVIIYLTATRGVILAMGGVAALVAIFFAFKRPAEPRGRVVRDISMGILAVGIAVAAGFFLLRSTAFVKENPVLARFASLSSSERTVQSRIMIWKIAWQGVKERPILGWGQENFYAAFNKYFDPKLWNSEPWFDRSHNFFFDWLIHAGVLGLAAYLTVIGVGVLNIKRAWMKGNFASLEGGLLVGLSAAYLAQNFFVFDNFQSYFFLFTLLGFSDFMAHRVSPGEANRSNREPAPLKDVGRVWILMGGTGIFILASLYYFNLKPILASREIIQGLSQANPRILPEVQRHFENALSYETFGSGEAREQLASLSRVFVARPPQVSAEDYGRYVEFTVREVEKLAVTPAADAKYFLFLGSIYNNYLGLNGDYARRAVDALESGIKLSPNKQQLYFELASVYLSVGQPARALELMQKAVELDPTFHGAQLNLAVTAIVAKKKDIADKALAEYRRLIPAVDVPSIQRLIQAYSSANDVVSIKPLIEEALKLEPRNGALYGQYAAVLYALGDREGARAAARQAGELAPELKAEAERFIKELDSGKPLR
ncbi:MAG: O-antigen ligase family protein [Candidatus Sungbacteria bacterium]|nr:O-antigen ligase family protein [Candidatus Sungbacteria bacterium]